MNEGMTRNVIYFVGLYRSVLVQINENLSIKKDSFHILTALEPLQIVGQTKLCGEVSQGFR